MSAANRGAIRAERDYYRTPDWAAEACIRALAPHVGFGTHVLDPCAGDGVFGDALLATGAGVRLSEIDIEPLGRSVVLDDFLTGDFTRWGDVNWVVGNPPYVYAEPFIRRAWEVADKGVAFLLRLNFLAGAGRARGLYREVGLPDVHVFPRRPSFTPDGKTDATDYAWFIWHKRTPTDTDPLPTLFLVDLP